SSTPPIPCHIASPPRRVQPRRTTDGSHASPARPARLPDTARAVGRLHLGLVARGETNARLVVKLVVGYPQGPLGWAMRGLLPWADLAMMRKQLLTLQRLAEASAAHAGAG